MENFGFDVIHETGYKVGNTKIDLFIFITFDGSPVLEKDPFSHFKKMPKKGFLIIDASNPVYERILQSTNYSIVKTDALGESPKIALILSKEKTQLFVVLRQMEIREGEKTEDLPERVQWLCFGKGVNQKFHLVKAVFDRSSFFLAVAKLAKTPEKTVKSVSEYLDAVYSNAAIRLSIITKDCVGAIKEQIQNFDNEITECDEECASSIKSMALSGRKRSFTYL